MLSMLVTYHVAFLGGLVVTVKLLAASGLFGVPCGILLGIMGARTSRIVGSFVTALHFFVGAVPILVLLFWAHYPLQSVFLVALDPFWTAVVVLGFVDVALTAELVRRELELLPAAYGEAAKTLGLSRAQVVRFVELPIVARRALPQFLANRGKMIEYTLFASFISVQELFRAAQTVNASVYRPVEVYSLLVIFFLAILGPLRFLIQHLEKRYAG